MNFYLTLPFCVEMIFLALFSLSVLLGTSVGLSMLYLPVEIENPVDGEAARKPEHKMTCMDNLRHYAREVRAPENAMRRRGCLVIFFGALASVSLVLHYWDQAEVDINRPLRNRQNTSMPHT